MGINRKDWIISANELQNIYSKCQDNHESFTWIDYINSFGEDISPMLILTKIQVLTSWLSNDLDDNIAVTKAEIEYTNDWIFF